MKTFIRNMTSRLLALLAALALVFAQGGAQAQPAHAFSQQELDQMLAPIALYPDPLLSQILMAATYPLEVVEAARWARARPGLAGDDAVRAAETEDWDPSVKSLLAFPQVLARMDENVQWTQSLGDAFLEQQTQVMDTIQALRRRAQAAGNLRSDDRVSVVQSGPSVLVQPFNPEVVYVPYYDPLVVYGSWWWPAPPMYLRPWPGYYARPAYAGGFYWGTPVGISLGFFFGAIDWRQRQVRVVHVNNYYYKPAQVRQIHANTLPGVNRPDAWHHDPDHRRGLNYRSNDTQQRFGAAYAAPARGTPAADARRSDRDTGARPDARFEARQSETRPAVETRPYQRPAPVAEPAQPAPIAKPAPAVQHAPADTRFDHRRETRGPAQPVPVSQSAPVAQSKSVAHSAPVVQPAPVVNSAPVLQPAPVMHSAPVVQSAAVVHSAPAAQPVPAWRGDRQAARPEPGARLEAPRPAQPRPEIRPAPGVARQESAPVAVPRHEPPARQQTPQASAPRADARAAAAAAREDTGVKVFGRPRMVQ